MTDSENGPWAHLVRALGDCADQIEEGDLSGLPATEYQVGMADGLRAAANRARAVLVQTSVDATPTDPQAVLVPPDRGTPAVARENEPETDR